MSPGGVWCLGEPRINHSENDAEHERNSFHGEWSRFYANPSSRFKLVLSGIEQATGPVAVKYSQRFIKHERGEPLSRFVSRIESLGF